MWKGAKRLTDHIMSSSAISILSGQQQPWFWCVAMTTLIGTSIFLVFFREFFFWGVWEKKNKKFPKYRDSRGRQKHFVVVVVAFSISRTNPLGPMISDAVCVAFDSGCADNWDRVRQVHRRQTFPRPHAPAPAPAVQINTGSAHVVPFSTPIWSHFSFPPPGAFRYWNLHMQISEISSKFTRVQLILR